MITSAIIPRARPDALCFGDAGDEQLLILWLAASTSSTPISGIHVAGIDDVLA